MSKKEEQSSAVNSLVDIIKVLVRDEINKQDNTVLCKVASVNDDGSYNVYVIPDESTIISNIPALNTFDLEPGDEFEVIYESIDSSFNIDGYYIQVLSGNFQNEQMIIEPEDLSPVKVTELIKEKIKIN